MVCGNSESGFQGWQHAHVRQGLAGFPINNSLFADVATVRQFFLGQPRVYSRSRKRNLQQLHIITSLITQFNCVAKLYYNNFFPLSIVKLSFEEVFIDIYSVKL